MKKILALVLAMMMLLSMAACGTDTDKTSNASNDSLLAGNTPSASTENGTAPAQNDASAPAEAAAKYPLPELKPDGSTSVDLDSEQVIYDKNGIKVTYKGYVVKQSDRYDLTVVVENNATENLRFFPYAAVINGMTADATCSIHDEPMAKGETRECVINVSLYDDSFQDDLLGNGLKCFELHFGFYDAANVYGSPVTLIDNNVVYSFTRGQHDHRNDTRIIMGELIYENDELVIYLEKTLNENSDKYYSNATIVNKTGKAIYVSSGIECRYSVAPPRPHYGSLLGFGAVIAPNSYRTGEVYIDEEWSSLDMTEIILKKQCYYATYVDTAVNEDDCIDEQGHEGLEKMNCFSEKITVPVTVNKNHG